MILIVLGTGIDGVPKRKWTSAMTSPPEFIEYKNKQNWLVFWIFFTIFSVLNSVIRLRLKPMGENGETKNFPNQIWKQKLGCGTRRIKLIHVVSSLLLRKMSQLLASQVWFFRKIICPHESWVMIFDDLEWHLFLTGNLQWQNSFGISYLSLYFKSLQPGWISPMLST